MVVPIGGYLLPPKSWRNGSYSIFESEDEHNAGQSLGMQSKVHVSKKKSARLKVPMNEPIPGLLVSNPAWA